jgi:hypothetical protein
MAVVKQKFKNAGIDTVKAVFKSMLEESAKMAVRAVVSGVTGS